MVAARVAAVPPAAEDPLVLFRIHWYNARSGGTADVPEHVVLGRELTGVPTPIVVLLGDRFPLIGAHKVLPAYAALVSRLADGAFDPDRDRAVWPSTGNYCRGGVAVSRLLGCRAVAVLPEGMSRERFDWLAERLADPADVVRTPGSESNVREIFETCRELARLPGTVVLDQFSDPTNYLAHYVCTGDAAADVFESFRATRPASRLRAFVAGTGSSGTLAAGDRLKERYGSAIAAAEPLECPTMLRNGFGTHNIQGIGDKHIPLIQNVMGMDLVVGISDRATDELDAVFGSAAGRAHLRDVRGVPADTVGQLASFGLSSICNVLAATRLARASAWGSDDVIVTVATDGASLYASERERTVRARFGGAVDETAAARALADHVGAGEVLALGERERERIFDLGYFTWVEQQGVSVDDFVERRDERFWQGLRRSIGPLDERIRELDDLLA